MKIVVIGGSLQNESCTSQILQLTVRHLKEAGVDAEIIDLRHLQLPFCNGSESYPNNPDVALFRQKIKHAHGVIVVTPEYHGSLSGVLKNALDLLTFAEVEGKVFALVSTLGGEMSSNALNHLRTICRSLHAWVLPQQLGIPFIYKALNKNGELIDPQVDQRLQNLVKHFIHSTQRLAH